MGVIDLFCQESEIVYVKILAQIAAALINGVVFSFEN